MLDKKRENLLIFCYALVSYFLTLSTVVGFHHKNNNFSVFLMRFKAYFAETFLPFLIAIVVVGVLFQAKIFKKQSLSKRLGWTCGGALLVSYLTSLFYIILVLLFPSGGSGFTLNFEFDVAFYGFVVSLMGLLYASPGAIGFGLLIGYRIQKKLDF